MSPQPVKQTKPAIAPAPASPADVTGKKGRPKGVPTGPRTDPMLRLWDDTPDSANMRGAIASTARKIAARNADSGGYVNKDMIYRELENHSAFQVLVPGPAGSNVQPVKAYTLLTPKKVWDTHQEIVERWQKKHPEGDPFASAEEGGPNKGAFAQLVRARAQVDVDDL